MEKNNLFDKIKNKLFDERLGVLIFGFPGIGKTYATEYFKDRGTIVDVDCSGTTSSILHKIYSLIGNADIIYVSSNPEIIEAVFKTDIPKRITICAVYPGKELKDSYLQRLKDDEYDSNKLNNIKRIYDEWVEYLTTANGKFIKIEFYEEASYLTDSDIMELIGGSLFARLYVETYGTEKKGK